MNLKPRFMLLAASLFIVSAVCVSLLVRQLSIQIIEQWAVRYAEKQVLYDKARMVQPILREIALSFQLANSSLIKEWAQTPNDPVLKRRAINEMETFRLNFADHSYFVALLSNGDYYHNNAANEFAGQQYRYTLHADKPSDRWFYDIIAQNRDMHLNVNPDLELGVTKLWIDVLIRDGAQVYGVAGTGLDLTDFINNVVDQHEPGITSLFTDHEGAVQIYRNQQMIDFASITKQATDKAMFKQLLSSPEEIRQVDTIMQQLQQKPDQVLTTFVTLEGRRHLAGIAFIPEIGWYEITLLDLNIVLPFSSFSGILIAFGLLTLAILLLLHLALGRYVIKPLEQLEGAIESIGNGRYPTPELPSMRNDEIGRLLSHFRAMAAAVTQIQMTLEQKVQQRTEDLELLSKTDPLTSLLNRRGMNERLQQEFDRFQRERSPFGLIWLDLDHFKEINDHYGHEVGDRALQAVADEIHATLRSYDSAARWGGDEFLILIQGADVQLLMQLSERLLARVSGLQLELPAGAAPLQLTLSAGTRLAQIGDDLQETLRRADAALYRAKEAGRNCYRSADLTTS